MAPYKSPEDQREQSRIYYQCNRERILARCKANYVKHPRIKHPRTSESEVERNRQWRKEHPRNDAINMKARRYTKLASNCAHCGTTEHLERHHPDYSKPLDIVTLCHSCHMKLHPRGKMK